MTRIPLKIKKEILADPVRKYCALEGRHGHVCGGRVTWEHALMYAGKQVQEKWAIVSLCERGHAVNRFQDAGTMVKDMNVWVALNQATEDDLGRFPRMSIPLLSQRERLNRKYGEYIVTQRMFETGIQYDILDREYVDKSVDNVGVNCS